jgi:hypothetical protein
MRTCSIFTLALTLAWSSTVLAADDGPPKGWLLAGAAPSDYVATIDRSAPRVGQASAVLRARDTPRGFGTLMQTFDAKKLAGKRYRMTAWVRSEGVEQWAGLWMRVDSEVKMGVSFDNMQARPIKGTTPWTKHAIVLDVPKDATLIAFGVLLDGKGAIWVDEFDFNEVGTHVPTTDLLTGGYRGAMSNLDFELGPIDKLPTGWLAAGERPTAFEMHTVRPGRMGGAGALLRAKGRPEGFGTLMQLASAEAYRGKRVRMTAWARSDGVTGGWAGLWFRVDDRSSSTIAFDNMEDRAITGTTPWRRYEIVLDVAPNAVAVAFGVLLTGEGAVTVDDFTFEVVDASVPVTDTLKREKATTFPVNTGFEN